MPRRPRAAIGILVAIAIATAAACAPAPDQTPVAFPTGSSPAGSAAPAPTPPPAAGNEVYGFVPYWEMDDGIAAHLRATNLTTLALFSVTNTRKGAIDTKQKGYRRITGTLGAQVIREARERGVRVDLVFTSFGRDRNDGFFADRTLQDTTIVSLVSLVGELGLDGVNVDVEALDPALVTEYGGFLGRLRDALVAADPADRLSVATSASLLGATMAAAAAAAGVDRIFLMGYDYRVAGSEPGATSPLDRRDGGEKDLVWSLDLYRALGVPAERTLLGLPLYGVSWPVTDPELGAPATGRGQAWILRKHVDLLGDPTVVPLRDEIEVVELYVLDGQGVPYRRPAPGTPIPASPAPAPSSAVPSEPAGPTASAGPSTSAGPIASAAPMASPQAGPWRAIYVDSPDTLTAKLGLARERGLAGAGFWAIGYERGLPDYTELIGRFAAGGPLE